MRIAALSCRSFYSLLRGSVSVLRWVQRAAEYGYGAVALADVNSMAGTVDLCRAAEQRGIQPIVGVEILTDRHRAVLLAEDARGYGNLCRITTARNLREDFDLVEQLRIDCRGVICICSEPVLLRELAELLPCGSLFAGCGDSREAECAVAGGMEPIVRTRMNWLAQEDIEIAKVLTRIRQLGAAGPGPGDDGDFRTMCPVKDIEQEFRSCRRALANADRLVERCGLRLLGGKPILPRIILTPGTDGDRELSRLCHVALARKYRPAGHAVIRRLEHELETVRKNGFSDYFLVVHEIVDFARQQHIPVEVRGSAAGSLIAHVLGFTRVCPIENRLYFERFMNPGRTDCPDIDIDLCWRRRDEVIRFCYEHWGFERVAMVCNINRYRLRSAIRDVGRVLGLEPVQINQLSREGKIKRTSPLYTLAQRLVGIPRHLGVHCGGIVVTPCPVARIAPLERANKGVIIMQYDKDAAEAVGLVKIDLLGNRSLSTVHEAIEIIRSGPNGDGPLTFDPNDVPTARMLSAGDSLGVFQSESPGMRQLLCGLKVRSRKDLAIALSLIRPGPASGGTKSEFIDRHVHGKPFTYLHPKIETLLADTYGLMLFQEDVMRIAVEVAGYTVAEADRFRSEVSKKVSAAGVQAQYVDFVHRRAERAGIERKTAEAIWDDVLRFAAYSYCKAHATVYANIAWQTAWLKAHYPQQFYCSLFNNHQGMYPLRVYVWDAKRHGIQVLAPHVNRSEIEWSLQDGRIYAGLNIIGGLCGHTAGAIVEQRRIAEFRDLDDLQRRVKFRRHELQNLIHVGACDGLGSTRPAMLGRLRRVQPPREQLMLFDLYGDPPAQTLPDYDALANLKAQLDVTGIPFGLHPAALLPKRHVQANRLREFFGRRIAVAGFVAAARRARTSDNRVMGFVTLEDATGLIEVSFFPDKLPLYRTICSYGGPVWVSGKVTEHLSCLSLDGSGGGALA